MRTIPTKSAGLARLAVLILRFTYVGDKLTSCVIKTTDKSLENVNALLIAREAALLIVSSFALIFLDKNFKVSAV